MYNYNSHYYGSGGQGGGSSGRGSVGGSPQGGSLSGRMDETAAVALLQHLGKEDLEHLISNDGKLTDLIQDLQQVRSVQSDHDELVASNKSLAEYNLSLQPRLDSLKTEVATGYETLNQLKTQLAMDKARLDEYVGDQKLDTLHALLQTASAQMEEESEKLAESFCERNMSIDEFLSRFIPSRMTAHKRRIKAEKMGELLREGGNPSPWTSSQRGSMGVVGKMGVAAPYPVGPPTSSSSAVPYPTGPSVGSVPYPLGSSYGMPQPSMFRH